MGDFAEVVAGVGAALAAYAQALDDGRTDDVLATFCADGSVELPGMGRHEGHEALRAAYAGWVPRQPQRHLVFNTHVTAWDDHEASATSDLVFLLQHEGRWRIHSVGRYTDVLHNDGGTWRFHRRTADLIS